MHRAFGEPLAVLAGDALIVLAFETLASRRCSAPARLAPLMLTVARSVGMPDGIAAGQAWECEPSVDLAHYHRAKTGALFAAATMAGAAAAGCEAEPWRVLGERLGEAFQVADDIRDVAASARNSASRSARTRRSAAECGPRLGLDGARPAARASGGRGGRLDSALPRCGRAAHADPAQAKQLPAQGTLRVAA